MARREKIVALFVLVLAASVARADDGLLFSVRPLAFLHAALRPEAATPAVLIPGAMDPHHYTLTVADMARLRQAQLLFWLGSTNEPYLARLAGGRSGTPIWIAIGGNQPFGESAQAMAAALSQRYPAEAASIQTRADQLLQARKKQEEFWRQQLAPFTQQHFLLGHNALLPLVEGLGLQGARIYQAESGHGHAQGGMQELLTLQQEVASGKIRCAIEEPGIRFQALAKKHPGLRLAYIEPMGGNLAITPDASLTLFNTTAAALQRCLAGEKKQMALVYSTDKGRISPKPASKPTVPAGDGKVRIRRETKGRKGAGVTLVTGIPLPEAELKNLHSELKKKCGVGGTIKDGVLELQGDQREVVLKALSGRGWDVKIAGG